MTAAVPCFDVVVPAYEEAEHIATCLDHVLAQEYPQDRIRVWVVDAGSTDRTTEVVAARARGDARVALLAGEGRLNAAQALNAGIARGSAPLVARVDAHTALASDYLVVAARLFSRHGPQLACVGGQPEQVGETRFGRGLALARRSRLGVGGSVYAENRRRAFVDTVQGGVYRRTALESIGGFATNMLVGEDEELNWRLRRAGYRILLDTDLRFRYTVRSTWRGAFRQYLHYGQSRARVLAAHPAFLRPRHLAPSVLVVAATATAAAAPVSGPARRTLRRLLAAYAGAALAGGVLAARRDDPGLAAVAATSFPALHLGYGIGFLSGLLRLLEAASGRSELSLAVERR
jgi:succinoglycan biosynthesis protein ExoA